MGFYKQQDQNSRDQNDCDHSSGNISSGNNSSSDYTGSDHSSSDIAGNDISISDHSGSDISVRYHSDRDTDPNIILRLLKNIWRNIKITGPYFLIGVALSAIFQRYVPESTMVSLFGGNKAFGVLMAATIGVPLYACGGGTIPLLRQWMVSGMSMGAVASFMITGPATKITNLGALKIVLGIKRFAIYIAFSVAFAFTTGLLIDIFM